jgi:deoxyadenosine/deoxycytidine kinase
MGGNVTKRIVFIEGNISSGKSTLIKGLREKGYTVFEEPASKWTDEYKDEQGVNSLELFYQNMKGNAFRFEMLAMKTRWDIIKAALQSPEDVVFIERSLLTDINTFALNLYEQKLLDALEWQIYREWYQDKIEDVNHLFEGVQLEFLYLRTDPKICFERKLERNRNEERHVPLEYFETIHQKHDLWLNQKTFTHNKQIYEPIVIDGNETVEEVLETVIFFFR